MKAVEQKFRNYRLLTIGGSLAVILFVGILGSSRAATALCGDGVLDAGEDCDLGGTCVGSSNAGTHCTSDAACPSGTCKTFGGQGCASNCTVEHDVPCNLVPAELDGLNLVPKTSGVAIASDFLSLPVPVSGACSEGADAHRYCAADNDCPGGTCRPSQQVLTVGNQRNGKVPVVVKAASVKYPAVKMVACSCIRGVVAKTCGGTFLEPDGRTLSLDCTPGFTAGESECTAAGKPPCTFVHGEGNSAAGEIGCDGADSINVLTQQDSGGVSRVAGPPMVTLGGQGGPGSASILNTIGITAGLGGCIGTDLGTYGPDGVFCTADDPPGGIIAVEYTSPAVTGSATAVVLNANGTNGISLGPVTATGAPFNCSALAQGSAAGAGLVQAFVVVHLDTVGDVAVTGQFFASSASCVGDFCESSCVGDCSGSDEVTVNDLLILVNIALGGAQAAACPHGVPGGTEVDIAVILRAVGNALNGCNM